MTPARAVSWYRSGSPGAWNPWHGLRTFLIVPLLLAGLTGCAFLGGSDAPAPVAAEAPTGPARPEVLPPPLILISFDGYRWDYPDRFETPNLDRLLRDGVRAERLIPVFPTKTFPNHYSLVTGLYPENHGIVANKMYDPVLDAHFRTSDRAAVRDARWWGGEPVWVTAQRQGLYSGTIFWPGSEAPIGGLLPTSWLPFDDSLPHRQRVDLLLSWLDLPEAERPSLLTLYFSEVDSAGHNFGPDSLSVEAAVQRVDESLGLLLDGLEQRGLYGKVHILVVSDHGMAKISDERVIELADHVDLERARAILSSPLLLLFPPEEDVEEVYQQLVGAHPYLHVYRRDEIPEHFHFRGHHRIPPILGVADEGWTLVERYDKRVRGGAHGYDNQLESMGAIFVAAGPQLRQGVTVPPFEAVDVYSLMCHLLDVEPAPNDGDFEAVRPVLRDGDPT